MKTMTGLIPVLVTSATLGLGSASCLGLETYFLPGSLSIDKGSGFSLDLYASTPDSSAAIAGWDIDVLFDTSQVQWVSTTLATGWDAVPGVADSDGLAGLALDPVWGSDILLATIRFRCLKAGTSDMLAGLIAGSDPNEGFLILDANSGAGGLIRDWTSIVTAVTQTSTSMPDVGSTLGLLLGAVALVSLGGGRAAVRR